MNLPVQKKGISEATDYRLLLASVEKRLLAGELTAGDRSLFGKPEVAGKMSPDQRLQWARLAQMAGEVEAALSILEGVNQAVPEYAEAWKARIELLMILDRRKEAAALLTQARRFVRKAISAPDSAEPVRLAAEPPVLDDAEFSSGPFERLRVRQQRIDRYMSIFSGRGNVFARQWADRDAGKQGYVPVRHEFTFQDAEDHLSGRKTYGIYLLKEDSTVSVGAIDADLKSDFRKTPLTAEIRRQVHREQVYMVSRIKELAVDAGTETLVEVSGGKGFHFWFFFRPSAPADAVRQFLTGIMNAVAGDLSVFSLEVFPKQDRLGGKGFGNLIKLPLGVHRLTGKTSCFPECADRSQEAQLEFLSRVRFLPPDRLKSAGHTGKTDPPLIHPRWKARADAYPDLFLLEKTCPPLGRIISLCRNGGTPTQREERVMFQTIGFLPRAKRLMHYLLGAVSDYNPHLVDFKLSRLRGTPMGCRRIHSLLSFDGDFCEFGGSPKYRHPLLHIDGWSDSASGATSEKAENLSGALDTLRAAIDQVLLFMA